MTNFACCSQSKMVCCEASYGTAWYSSQEVLGSSLEKVSIKHFDCKKITWYCVSKIEQGYECQMYISLTHWQALSHHCDSVLEFSTINTVILNQNFWLKSTFIGSSPIWFWFMPQYSGLVQGSLPGTLLRTKFKPAQTVNLELYKMVNGKTKMEWKTWVATSNILLYASFSEFWLFETFLSGQQSNLSMNIKHSG
jgi:hypothetical protein